MQYVRSNACYTGYMYTRRNTLMSIVELTGIKLPLDHKSKSKPHFNITLVVMSPENNAFPCLRPLCPADIAVVDPCEHM